ncbi:hypothetical protein CRYUN_Cryun13aG0034500 [Craigia yunnanensis]
MGKPGLFDLENHFAFYGAYHTQVLWTYTVKCGGLNAKYWQLRALYVHICCRKRAPALLDNLVQAFLMAPFFVLLEVLQSLFRYEPYSGFHGRVKAKIEAEIKEWQDKKQKKVS